MVGIELYYTIVTTEKGGIRRKQQIEYLRFPFCKHGYFWEANNAFAIKTTHIQNVAGNKHFHTITVTSFKNENTTKQTNKNYAFSCVFATH